jgi:hypothetical protein
MDGSKFKTGQDFVLYTTLSQYYVKIHTCSAEDIHVGSNGITGNMYSNGYNIDTNAITLIVRAL